MRLRRWAAFSSLSFGLTLLVGCNDAAPGDSDRPIVEQSGPVDVRPGSPGVQPPGAETGNYRADPSAESDVHKSITTGPDAAPGLTNPNVGDEPGADNTPETTEPDATTSPDAGAGATPEAATAPDADSTAAEGENPGATGDEPRS